MRQLVMLVYTLALATFLLGKATAQVGVSNFPIIVWIDSNGQLWITNEAGEARVLVDEPVVNASLSPDQTQLAYTTQENLVVLDLQTNAKIATLASATLAQNIELPAENQLAFGAPQWVSSSQLWFMTRFVSIAQSTYRYDIQTWEFMENRVVEIAPPNQGGQPIISPNLNFAAIYRPGRYGDENYLATIELRDIRNGQLIHAPITFPAVATGSEMAWFPNIVWDNTGTKIAFTMPLPDLLYMDRTQLPPTPVCTLEARQEAELYCQNFTMAYFANPVFQPDLNTFAFAQTTLNGTGTEIIVGEMATGEYQTIQLADGSLVEPILWLDDNRLLLREISGIESATPYLFSINLENPVPMLWPDENIAHQIINLQKVGEGQFALAVGDFANVTVMLYDEPNASLHPLIELKNVSWVAFRN